MQLPKLNIQLEGLGLEALVETSKKLRFLSADASLHFKSSQPISIDVLTASQQQCQILGALSLQYEIRNAKIIWNFLVMQVLGSSRILDTDIFKIIPGPE